MRRVFFLSAAVLNLASISYALAQEPVRQSGQRLESRETTPAEEAKEEIFSGPQVGEELPSFTVRGVFGDDAGRDLDFVKAADGKPIVLVFVHEMNRPSIGFTRALTTYTTKRAKDGLTTGVVWLAEDATEAENTLQRIKHAMTPNVPIGISPDGKEGPGSYGLNRNVTLTILVGDDGKVTENFALVQPSVQADLPKVFEAVVNIAGGEGPKMEDVLPPGMRMERRGADRSDPRLRELLAPVIRRGLTDEAVDRAAAVVERHAAENEIFRKEVGRITNAIIDNDKLENYGTARAQEHLRKWAKEYGKPVRGNDKPSEEGASSEKAPR